MMSEPTQKQIQDHATAIQVTTDDLAARVGFLVLQQEKLVTQVSLHISNFNDSQSEVIRLTAENTKLKAQVETLQAAQTLVSETATA
jgi:cell division protein FtsB